MPDQNNYFSVNPLWRETRKISSVPSSGGIRSALTLQQTTLSSLQYCNIPRPVSHRVPHTNKKGHESIRIDGVVRFVDLRMLLVRPISFSSTCPSAPLTHPANFFWTNSLVDRKTTHPQCGFSGERSLWDSCSLKRDMREKLFVKR